MAIRIRCSECRKKISIDEAFAGGMCRCPYCKAIVYVPEAATATGEGVRPPAPTGRPDAPQARPAAPGAAVPPPPPGAPAAAPAGEHIPMARPVKIQGIITMVLLVLLALMVAGGVTVALLYLRGPDYTPQPVPDDTLPPDLLAVSRRGPAVADIKLPEGPVLYVLDGGSSMRDAFDPAVVMTENSILSVTEKGTFTVLLCRETEDEFLSEDFQPGGEKGQAAARERLRNIAPSGATDLPRALKAALERKPKTLVLFARKPVDDCLDLAKQAHEQGVTIHAVVIDGDPEVNQSVKAIADATGGTARFVTSAEL
jgi:hypothetical protein